MALMNTRSDFWILLFWKQHRALDDEGEDALDMRKAMRRDTKKRSVVKAKKFEQKPWEIEWH